MALLGLLALSVTLSVSLLRTWAGPARLVLLVVAAQTGWHLVLSLVSGHAGDPVAAATAGTPTALLPADLGGSRTGSLHDVYLATVPTPAVPTGSGPGLLAHQVDHVAVQGIPMVAAHLLGAVLLGLFLARGEAALWSLLGLALARAQLALAGWRLLAAGAPSGPVLDVSVGPVATPRLLDSQVLLRSTVRRRGPPLLLTA